MTWGCDLSKKEPPAKTQEKHSREKEHKGPRPQGGEKVILLQVTGRGREQRAAWQQTEGWAAQIRVGSFVGNIKKVTNVPPIPTKHTPKRK